MIDWFWFVYCAGIPMRGLIHGSSSLSALNIVGMNGVFMFAFFSILGSKLKDTCPRQYCVWYLVSLRLIFKHSENEPNSMKLPSKIPDGIFPQASTTEYVKKIIFSELRCTHLSTNVLFSYVSHIFYVFFFIVFSLYFKFLFSSSLFPQFVHKLTFHRPLFKVN